MRDEEENEGFQLRGIGNFYGGLHVRQNVDGSFEWSIEDYDGYRWEKIPSYLGEALIKYHEEQTSNG